MATSNGVLAKLIPSNQRLPSGQSVRVAAPSRIASISASNQMRPNSGTSDRSNAIATGDTVMQRAMPAAGACDRASRESC
jgi:hypothetical protein